MTPLDDASALALVRECAAACVPASFAPHLPKGDFVHRAIVVYAYVGDQAETVRSRALAWRRTMETLNALACCRGLGVQENPRFWRQCLAMLSDDSLRESTLCLLDDSLFSTYRLRVDLDQDPEIVVTAIAIALAMDPQSSAQRVREDAHATVRAHLISEPPPSQFQLVLMRPIDAWGPWWEPAKALLWSLHRMWHADVAADPVKIDVVIGDEQEMLSYQEYTLSHTNLSDVRYVLSYSGIYVRELHIDSCDMRDHLSDTQILMQELDRVDTVEKITWVSPCLDAVAAFCSALPGMHSLTSLSLLVAGYSQTKAQRAAYYQWIAWALLERKWRGLALALEIQVEDGAKEAFEQALAAVNCLAQVVPDNVTDPVFMVHGSSAMLRAHAIVEMTVPDHGLCNSFLALKPTRVTVVVNSGFKALIVWPGVGLVWVRTRDLSDWKTRVNQGMRAVPVTKVPLLTSLSCIISPPTAITALLEVVGESILMLNIAGCLQATDEFTNELLARVLTSCPQLVSLRVVHCRLESVKPLLQGLERGDSNIASFACVPMLTREETTATITSLFKCLGDPRHGAARVIKALRLEQTALSAEQLAVVANGLRRNRNLEFLQVLLDDRIVYHDVPDSGDEALGDLVFQPIAQTTHSKRAMFSFLLAARRRPVLRTVPLTCVQLIARFAATPALRHLTWEVAH